MKKQKSKAMVTVPPSGGQVYVELVNTDDGAMVLLATSADNGSATIKLKGVKSLSNFLYGLYRAIRDCIFHKPQIK